MNCANHVDVPAVAYCRTCGKPLCSSCARDVRGVTYCEECLASHLSGTVPPPGTTAVPPGAPPETGTGSPGLAAILGFIPGVGAMYNGEYAKGFVTRTDLRHPYLDDRSRERHLRLGHRGVRNLYAHRGVPDGTCPADGFAGARSARLNRIFSSAGATAAPRAAVTANPGPVAGSTLKRHGRPNRSRTGASHIPIGAFILIGLGVLFLLNEMDVLNFDRLWRFWPLVLIAIGIRVLMRQSGMGW